MAKLEMKFSKVVLNGAGVREQMNSGEVQSELLGRAEAIANHARSFGGEYEALSKQRIDTPSGQTQNTTHCSNHLTQEEVRCLSKPL